MTDRDQQTESFISDRAPDPVGAYPHARRVGSLLFISGMGPRQRGSSKIPGTVEDGEGNPIGYDITAEAHAVFENLRFVLEEAGSSWERIVDVTVFLTDIEADFQRFNHAYREAFGSVQPTRTTVEVNRLPTPIHVELKVIATLP